MRFVRVSASPVVRYEVRHVHRRGRVWPKFLFGLAGAYFVAHGGLVVGAVMVALALVFLARR